MNEIIKLFKNEKFKTILVIVILFVLIYLFRGIVNILLLTLVITLLSKRLCDLLHHIFNLPIKYGIIIIYFTFILIVALVFNYAFMEIKTQMSSMIDMIIKFYYNPNQDNWLLSQIYNLFVEFDLKSQLTNSSKIFVESISNVTHMGITIFVSFLLSFFYLLEFERVNAFSKSFFNSSFGWFFQETYQIGKKFISSFGMVLETQFIISLINSLLTILALAYLGFPQLPLLWLLIFVLGLIPVAGVIISFVPLAIIGYMIGDINMIFMVLIIIVLIHFMETYFLNPKLMSHKTHLPIFYVFLILFVSETLFGMWGLIVGVPIFIFIIDMLGIDAKESTKKLIKLRKKKS
ncbi:MAG: AI-2E family transporter [Bacilli bacterium]|jgi:predicted PurR-regulated permease PerM|nr:AI-2E family transporter [Bacilli bacterium]